MLLDNHRNIFMLLDNHRNIFMVLFLECAICPYCSGVYGACYKVVGYIYRG